MKTAMQELIEIISQRHNDIINFNEIQFLKLLEPLLEKEKEQIKNDYNNGFYKKTLYLTSDDLEEYYNQTYNQNK